MAETVTMPKLGFDMAEGTLVRWVKAEGEEVKKGEILAEIETDKATVEVESTYSGTVLRQLVSQGTVVPVNAAIAVIGAPGEAVETPAAKQTAAARTETPKPIEPPVVPPVQTPAAVSVEMVKASPLAKRMAREKGVELSALHGSGPGGRIVRRDVEQAQAIAHASPTTAAAKPAPVVSIPPAWSVPPAELEDQKIQVERLRAAIGRRMTESKQQLPHFYVTHEYDVEALITLRKQVNAMLPEDQQLSVNDFVIKAVALALRQFPNLNASLAGDQIIRRAHVNIGVAVAVPGGLMTVVSRDTDQKPLRLLSTEVKEMVARARSGKVHPEDIEGSTFSVSNLGMFDVEHFIAIINPPEAAILAIGSARQTPVVEDGQLKVGMRMKATLSADHRISDGAEAAQYLQALAQFIENPVRLLI